MNTSDADNITTIAPTTVPAQGADFNDHGRGGPQMRPEFLRLPKSGTLCPLTGLGRSFINGLILPTEENGHRPPVKSISLRKRGAQKGVRLVVYDSLMAHLHAHLDGAQADATATTPPNPQN